MQIVAVASACQVTSKPCSLSSNIPVQASHVSPLTSVLQSHVVLSPSSRQKRTLLSFSTTTANAEFKKLLARSTRAVDNKLLVVLSAIAVCQSCATVATEQAVHLLLDYVATYPADGIVYRSSDMILCAHADAGFLNETNSRSREGAHIFLSEIDPFPRFNGAILSIAQIIKFVMVSAAESELAALSSPHEK